jgi:hypothetical protein
MEARPCRASIPQRGSIEPAPSPAFLPPFAALATMPRRHLVSCLVCRAAEPPPRCRPCARPRCRRRRPHRRASHRLSSRPLAPVRALARSLVSLARLAARGPAPRSHTAPIRERRRGAAAAHTLVVVAPVAATYLITYSERRVRAGYEYLSLSVFTFNHIVTFVPTAPTTRSRPCSCSCTGPAAKQERSGPQRTWTHLRALASWPHCHSQRRLPNGTRSRRPYLAAPFPRVACRCRRHRSRRVCDHSHRTRATRRIRHPWRRRCKCQLSRQHLT